jgi:hypothetical protein
MKRSGLTVFCLIGILISSVNVHSQEQWNSLNIINVQSHPWDESPRFYSQTKTIFKGPNDSGLIYARFAPGWDMTPPSDPLGPHYHPWHEWAYVLDGDFVIHEPVRPNQKSAMISHFMQGTWLDRPAYTLHGGSWEVGGVRPQNACTLIIFEEGDGSVVTVGPKGDHIKPDFPGVKPDPYKPDWQSVQQFNHPWIVHSGKDLDWESDDEAPGRLIKWLSDDQSQGFRGRLVKIPPGWKAPEDSRKYYYKNATRFIYMLYGDVKIVSQEDPLSEGKVTNISKDYFVQQKPMSIWAYADGVVTELGAMWLEVTYAKGVAVGGGEIEAPIFIN